MKLLLWLTLIVVLCPFAPPVLAGNVPEAYRSTGYPLPRFAALSSDKVYVRAGPGTKYPILWVFEKKNYPVEIILEFDTWRKIRGHDGEEGWVHTSLLSGKRMAYVTGEDALPLHRSSAPDSAVIAMLKPGVIAEIKECEAASCRLAVSGYRGWAERKLIWGVYASEILN